MMIGISVKSGTGGYYDEDGCDLLLKTIKDDKFPIPRIGETIEILEKEKALNEYHTYLVTNIVYWLNCLNDTEYGVTVYVVPIGRCM